jgi:hypothetical protein
LGLQSYNLGIDCGSVQGILERKYGGSLFESLLKKGEDAAKEELKETL